MPIEAERTIAARPIVSETRPPQIWGRLSAHRPLRADSEQKWQTPNIYVAAGEIAGGASAGVKTRKQPRARRPSMSTLPALAGARPWLGPCAPNVAERMLTRLPAADLPVSFYPELLGDLDI